MTGKSRYVFLLLAGVIAFFAYTFFSPSAKSYSSGAPAGYCGAPADGNANCTFCHNAYVPQPVTGAITSNIPVTGYQPAATYTITATISRAGHTRFGFQLSPQDNAGNLMGSMNDLGPETVFTGAGKYITHSPTGTSGTGTKSWQFEWTAPAAGTGNVTFYGAFNVTNDNGAPSGDTIFTTTYTVQEASSASISSVTAFLQDCRIVQNGNQLQVAFTNISGQATEISIYDLQGKLIRNIQPDGKSGETRQSFSMENCTGGIYVLNIHSGTAFLSKKFIYQQQ